MTRTVEDETPAKPTLWRLAIRLGVFLVLNAVVGLGVLMICDQFHHYEPWETDSIFEANPADEDYDLVLLGTSRAYALSRFRDNHEYLESALGMNVLNLGLPAAGGVKPTRCYLEHYLAAGVRPDHLVYLLDPFIFYGVGPNEYHKFVYFERFSPGFLIRMATRGVEWRRLLIYVRSKFTADWFLRGAEPLIRHDRTAVDFMTEELIAKRIDSLFLDGRDEANFERYARELGAILSDCETAGIPVILAYPPTLLGADPAQARMDSWLDELAGRHSFQRLDWTSAMADPTFFYDLDHMNAQGAKNFVDELLGPALRNQSGSSTTGGSG